MSAITITARRRAPLGAPAAPAAPTGTAGPPGRRIFLHRQRPSCPPRRGSWCAATTSFVAAAVKGWRRLLDPHLASAACTARTDPYALRVSELDLRVLDSADADDFTAPTEKVAAYATQMATLLKTAPSHAWLLTHRPLWALAQGDLAGKTLNATLQEASHGQIPPGLDIVVSGHLHDFTSYEFGPERPAQLIVGDSGDTMLPLGKAPLLGAVIDGFKTRKAFALERFGFFLLERTAAGWDGTLYDSEDSALARCKLSGRALECQ